MQVPAPPCQNLCVTELQLYLPLRGQMLGKSQVAAVDRECDVKASQEPTGDKIRQKLFHRLPVPPVCLVETGGDASRGTVLWGVLC